jgi:hypothetical protein
VSLPYSVASAVALGSAEASRDLVLSGAHAFQGISTAAGVGAHELFSSVNDFSTVQHIYWGVPGAFLVSQTVGAHKDMATKSVITRVAIDVLGANWTGMPSTPAKLILHTALGAAAFFTVSDPSANVSDLNQRHTISTSVSIDIDPTDDFMLEAQGPSGGSGSSRQFLVYCARIRFAPKVTWGGSTILGGV